MITKTIAGASDGSTSVTLFADRSFNGVVLNAADAAAALLDAFKKGGWGAGMPQGGTRELLYKGQSPIAPDRMYVQIEVA